MNEINTDHEIQKFDQQAHQWWDRNGPLKTLHTINPVRQQFIQDHAEPMQEKRLIDIGCGAGILTESLAPFCQTVTGIDRGAELIHVAKQHAQQQQHTINYYCTSVEQMAHSHPQQFDIVTCMELLEHLAHPEKMVQHCATLCKPGGLLFFATINRQPKAYLLAILAAEYLLRLLPKGTHRYQQFIKPSELQHWCTSQQLRLVGISGMHYNPITHTASLNADASVNYLSCYSKINTIKNEQL